MGGTFGRSRKEPAFWEHAPYPGRHDNRDAADTVRVLVNRWGYDCLVAYDGFAGLKAAREYRPDCMLLDIGLPGLDGYALVRRVKALPGLGQVKLIAITAYAGKGGRSWHRPPFSSPRVAWNRSGVVEGHTGRAVPCTASLAGRRAQASSVCRSRAGSFPNSREG